MNLYEITKEQEYIISLLEDNGGEATEEILQALEITREQFSEKAKNYTYVIMKYDREVDMLDNEIARLTALKKSKANAKTKLKEALTTGVLAFGSQDPKSGVKRFETATFKLSTRESKAVEITDEESIPEQYWVIKKEVSKTAISNALKAGEEIMGASFKTNYSITIK